VVIADQGLRPHASGPNWRRLSRKAIFVEIDASLTRLGMDYIDLYQIIASITNADRRDAEAAARRGQGLEGSLHRASSMHAWEFPGRSASREARLDPLRQHAEPRQLLYREEEREMLPLCERRASASSLTRRRAAN